jgi:glyoxylase-like metal-dependent hydrolase (beta-lactamase superfamily II)
MTSRPRLRPDALLPVLLTFLILAAPSVRGAQAPRTPGDLEYFRLVPGFIAETKNERGMAVGTGFATPNPWGAYTAYLLGTNAKGQRTWRIENYLPQGATAQGSTMYLLEGSSQALLVDTAQNTMPEVMGQNDLKTVVRHLLGHNNDGTPRANPVDFVVCNTHGHGDHTGKNSQMSDRTVYFPKGDMPRTNPPANYVPADETPGEGVATEIVLGNRTVKVINLYGHTTGSLGYLDAENRMVMTGDEIGSGYVWMHLGGTIAQYARSVRHLQEVLRPLDNPAVLPAHFYQVDQPGRLRTGPLDKAYVDDQVAIAEGLLAGTTVGVPYRSQGRNVLLGRSGAAEATYTLNTIFAADAPPTSGSPYQAVQIPGPIGGAANGPTPAPAVIDGIKSGFFLIRDRAQNSLYLIKGSSKALLVGTGGGAPGLAAIVGRLAGTVPVEIAVLSDDPGQIGGLAQFAANKIHLPRGAAVPRTGLRNVTEVGRGDVITLGQDGAGRPLEIQVHPLAGHSPAGLTLLDVNDRVLLSGDALGMQGNDNGLVLREPLASFAASFKAWREQTDGKYDLVYTSRNFEWQTPAAFVEGLQTVVNRGLAEGDAALADSTALAGRKVLRAALAAPAAAPGAAGRAGAAGGGRGGRGGGDSAASIIVP